MTFEQIKEFFKENIRYKDWEFHIGQKPDVAFVSMGQSPAIYLQVRFLAICSSVPSPHQGVMTIEKQYCRKWQLSEHMTPTELVRTAWLAVKQAEEHEAAENFLFDGKAIYNPHIDVEELKNATTRHDVRRPR